MAMGTCDAELVGRVQKFSLFRMTAYQDWHIPLHVGWPVNLE